MARVVSMLVVGPILGAPPILHAQSAPEAATALARLTGQVIVDGQLNDWAWRTVPVIVPLTYLPRSGQNVSQRTAFQIAYDGQALYVAARMAVTDRSQINGYSLHRDRVGKDDVVRLLLDTFDDREHAVAFATTPTGVRIDFAVAKDGAETNLEWNAAWTVETAVTDSGWTAEFRIPFRGLRFNRDAAGKVRMGFTLSRFIASTNETYAYPALPAGFAGADVRPSLAARIELRPEAVPQSILLTPYAATGTNVPRSSVRVHAGADATITLSSNATLDATVNPDFAEAEADDHQVNLSRFPIFFTEKRAFFQDRASLFEMNTGSDRSRVFHSRRIGLRADGTPLTVYAGARSVARLGIWDAAGLLVEAEHDSLGGGGTAGVGRLRREIDERGSAIGGIVTVRNDRGFSNTAYGADALLHRGANDLVTLQTAQTVDTRIATGLSSSMLRMAWDRRASAGLGFSLDSKWTGSGYHPALGFEPRAGETQFSSSATYGWLPSESDAWGHANLGAEVAEFRGNAEWRLSSRFMAIFAEGRLRSGLDGVIEIDRSTEILADTLRLAENALIPPGRYDWPTIYLRLTPGPRRRMRATLSASSGGLYDGREITLTASPIFTISRNAEVGIDLERRVVTFAPRAERLDADIARARLDLALTRQLSGDFFAQYSRADRVALFDGRLRLNYGEARDLYIVYRESSNPAARQRRLALKITQRLGD